MHMPTPLHVADPHEVPGLTMCQPEGADQCCASAARSSRRFRILEELLQSVETSVNVLDVVGCIVLLRQ